MESDMISFCAERARKGDGAFAIAYAILQLADSQDETSRAIQRLGNAGASTPFGALESLGLQIEKAAGVIAAALSESSN